MMTLNNIRLRVSACLIPAEIGIFFIKFLLTFRCSILLILLILRTSSLRPQLFHDPFATAAEETFRTSCQGTSNELSSSSLRLRNPRMPGKRHLLRASLHKSTCQICELRVPVEAIFLSTTSSRCAPNRATLHASYDTISVKFPFRKVLMIRLTMIESSPCFKRVS